MAVYGDEGTCSDPSFEQVPRWDSNQGLSDCRAQSVRAYNTTCYRAGALMSLWSKMPKKVTQLLAVFYDPFHLIRYLALHSDWRRP